MRSICPVVLLLLLGVGAGVADTLTADLVRSAKGDGPDGKGNTSDDTWQFWFELAHKRGSFERLDTHSKSVPKEGIAKKITGPIAGLLPNPADSAGWILHRDWDGRFEGVWGDSKTGNVLLYPYVEKNAHMAVAVSYTVPADGPHDISGSLTDLQVAPDFKQHDGVEWTIEIVEAGKAARQVGKGGPLGDGHGRPDRDRFHIQAVELKKGQLVRLCVHPRKWWGTDLTRIEAFCIEPSRPTQPRHGVVFADGDTFAGWPANGGLWPWADGEEALVAFVTGKYVERKGHNLEKPYTNRLGRTRDGGKTWTVEVPAAGFYQPKMKVEPLAKAIPFQAEGFAMRVVAEGYHGSGVSPGAAVCFTTDRGKTWQGPYALPELLPGRLAEGRDEITARTDYIVLGPEVCLLLATARPKDRSAPDRPFAVRLSEGGRKAE